MRLVTTSLLVLALGCATATASTASAGSLRDVARIESGLFSIAVADKIRRSCDAISGRYFRARQLMLDLLDHARGEGFSDAEIDAYVTNPAEKNRMRAKRDVYLANQGVVKTAPETYCAAGRAEIEKSSQIGALLRAR